MVLIPVDDLDSWKQALWSINHFKNQEQRKNWFPWEYGASVSCGEILCSSFWKLSLVLCHLERLAYYIRNQDSYHKDHLVNTSCFFHCSPKWFHMLTERVSSSSPQIFLGELVPRLHSTLCSILRSISIARGFFSTLWNLHVTNTGPTPWSCELLGISRK